jgi:hypothetical protein
MFGVVIKVHSFYAVRNKNMAFRHVREVRIWIFVSISLKKDQHSTLVMDSSFGRFTNSP